MRVLGGEHQGRAFDRQHQGVAAGAVDLLGIDRVQGRQARLLHRRQRPAPWHRFRLVERGRGVERQRQLIAVLRRQRRDVLELRGTERIEDAGDVDHRADIGTVVAVAGLRRGAGRKQQVGVVAAGQRLDDRGAVAVVEDQRLLPRHQARRLHLRQAVEALLVDLDGEAARQQRRRLLQPRRVALVEQVHGGEIAVQARAVQRRLVEILQKHARMSRGGRAPR